MTEDPLSGAPSDYGKMLHAVVGAKGLSVEVWQRQGSEHLDQDRWLVTGHDELLRVAAIDGVTPWRTPPAPGGDAAQMAAATVAGTLLLPLPAREALRLANGMLHRPEVRPSRRQAMAAAAVADCAAADGGVSARALVAADCEVWGADGSGRLALAAGGDFLRPEVRAAWLELRSRLAPDADVFSAEAQMLDDPGTQTCHAVGRYPDPVWSWTRVTAKALVVASDGCRLLEWAATREPTVAGLGSWLRSVASRATRDDLTCLLVRPAR